MQLNLLHDMKVQSPLIHFITNYVTVNDMANTALAFGGKPLMAEAIDELDYITAMANVLVINIGTLTPNSIASMMKACEVATRNDVPIILDPVGAGATPLRKSVCMDILEKFPVAIIKGNLSEIKTLLDAKSNAIGIDSLDTVNDETPLLAKACSERFNCVTAITGEKDIIADTHSYHVVDWNIPKLALVTGTGCMISAIIGVYLGQGYSPLEASTYGVASMTYSGLKAEDSLKSYEGLGTYKVKLFDNFTSIRPEELIKTGGIHAHAFQ